MKRRTALFNIEWDHLAGNRNLEQKQLNKNNLVPPKDQYHRLNAVNEFISNRFDRYAREYGQFFVVQIQRFEDKLEALKKEIQINALAEKRTNSVGKRKKHDNDTS